MSYWSQADMEGLIGQQTVLNLYQDGGAGVVNQTYLAETQSLSDAEIDGAIATEYPGVPLPVVQVFPTWAASANYTLKSQVIPSVPNGYAFRCVGAPGVSGGAEPTWPTLYGVTVNDGSVQWLCSSLTPQLIRHASLLWGRALSYERHPDYVRRYGDGPRKAAEAYLNRLIGATRYFTDLLSGALPANIGGAAVDGAHRLYVTSPDGRSNAGDF